jgi:hypothetical protein
MIILGTFVLLGYSILANAANFRGGPWGNSGQAYPTLKKSDAVLVGDVAEGPAQKYDDPTNPPKWIHATELEPPGLPETPPPPPPEQPMFNLNFATLSQSRNLPYAPTSVPFGQPGHYYSFLQVDENLNKLLPTGATGTNDENVPLAVAAIDEENQDLTNALGNAMTGTSAPAVPVPVPVETPAEAKARILRRKNFRYTLKKIDRTIGHWNWIADAHVGTRPNLLLYKHLKNESARVFSDFANATKSHPTTKKESGILEGELIKERNELRQKLAIYERKGVLEDERKLNETKRLARKQAISEIEGVDRASSKTSSVSKSTKFVNLKRHIDVPGLPVFRL